MTVDTAELHSDFTSWIKQAQLVVVEEMMAFGRRDLMNKLKPMITQPHLRINEKYVPQYDMPNRANFLLFSNHKDAILLDEGDRRYFVYYSPAEPKTPDYYVTLFGWLEENAGVLLHWLQNRALTNFNPKARPPMTAAKREVIESSRPPLESYLLDKFGAEEWPFSGDLVVPSHIADVLPPRFKATASAVGRILKKFGGVNLGQKRMGDQTKPTVYAMKKTKKWKQADENTIAEKYEFPSRPM